MTILKKSNNILKSDGDKDRGLKIFTGENNLYKFILIMGESLALFFGINFLLATMGFWVTLPLIQYSFLFSVIISSIFAFFRLNKNYKSFLPFLLIFSFIFIIPTSFTSGFHDFGWDSNVFHQLFIISLENGQNPVYINDVAYLNETRSYVSELSPNILGISEWVRSKFIRDAKAFHVLAGSINSFTGDLQSSKSITIIGCIMGIFLFFIMLKCIFFNASTIYLSLISFVAGINSVVICSSLSFYVDGFLYISLLTLISLFSLYLILKQKHILYIALLYSIVFINIKSTAILFFVILAITLLLIYYRYDFSLIIANRWIIIPFIILLAMCSYHPFIQNIVQYNDISGGSLHEADNFADIPNSWKTISTPEKFILSLFSKAHVNPVALEKSEIKVPFIDISDLGIYVNDPPKVGGWGPLFSGIMLFSFLFFLYQIYQISLNRAMNENSEIFIFYMGMIIVTIIIFQLSWYARYLPQLSLVPIFMTLPYFKREIQWENYIRIFISILLLINIVLVGSMYYPSQQNFSDVQKEVFDVIQEKLDNHVYIVYEGGPYSSAFVYAYIYQLMEKEIEFTINPQEIKNPMELPTIIVRDFRIFGSVPDHYLQKN